MQIRVLASASAVAVLLTLLQGCASPSADEESEGPASQAIAHDEKVTQRLFTRVASKGDATRTGFDSWTGYRVAKRSNGPTDFAQIVVLQALKAGEPVFEVVFREGHDEVAFRTVDLGARPFELSQEQAAAVVLDLADLKERVENTQECLMAWLGSIVSGLLALPVTALAGVACVAPGSPLCMSQARYAFEVDSQLVNDVSDLVGCIDP